MSSGYSVLFVIYIAFISVVLCANLVALFVNLLYKFRLSRLQYDAARGTKTSNTP